MLAVMSTLFQIAFSLTCLGTRLLTVLQPGKCHYSITTICSIVELSLGKITPSLATEASTQGGNRVMCDKRLGCIKKVVCKSDQVPGHLTQNKNFFTVVWYANQADFQKFHIVGPQEVMQKITYSAQQSR